MPKFALTAELDALYERGWPEMHLLTDEPLTTARAKSIARKQFSALDPVWRVEVPRASAHRFLHAHLATPMEYSPEGKAAREQALSISEPFPEAGIEAILALAGPDLRDTYAFTTTSAVWLLEALFGTRRVARAAVARLTEIAAAYDGRDESRVQYDNASFGHYRLAFALASLRPRLGEGWDEVVAPLAGVGGDRPFDSLLRRLAGVVEADTEKLVGFFVEVAIGLGDTASLREHFSNWSFYFWTPRFYYLLGHDAWDATEMRQLPRQPAWLQRRIVSWFGTIRHPATARAMLWLMRSRSAKKQALAWLTGQAELATPEVQRLTGDPKIGPQARDALEALGGKPAPAATARLSPRQAEAEIAALMGGLEARLMAAAGDRDAEREVLEQTLERYAEIRAATGDITPEAYFTHTMAELKWRSDRGDVDRWFELAVDLS